MTHRIGSPFVLSLMAAIIGLTACATTTPYQEAGVDGGYGFTDQQIEDNRYRISFRGNSLTSREQVEDFLLYRAAELTVQNGYDYFVVVEDDTERTTTYTGTRDRGFYNYYGFGRPFPYYGYGYRWDPLYEDFSVRERNRYSAIAYVVMERGAKPENSPAAYDARQVIENIGPRVLSVSSGS